MSDLWGPRGEARPTFTAPEWTTILQLASASGRPVVAHASTVEGIQRAIDAGVETIEHGDAADAEVFATTSGGLLPDCWPISWRSTAILRRMFAAFGRSGW